MADAPNTAEPGKPRRRWFQFRLRTLLVGVTLLAIPCAYVAHEYRIVAARKSWMAQHPQGGYDVFGVGRSTEPTLSLVRRLLGDEPQEHLVVTTLGDEASARDLFPEAGIIPEYDGSNQSVGDQRPFN